MTKDQADYFRFLEEISISQEQMDEAAKRVVFVGMPVELYGRISISKSQIQGRGAFALIDFIQGQYIAPARFYGQWTVLGRFCNHSCEANSFVHAEGLAIKVVAAKNIHVGDEITLCYRQVREIMEGAAAEAQVAYSNS